jgi:hypothetical protein
VVAFALGEFFKEGKLGVGSGGWGSVLGRKKAPTENDQPHLVGARDVALNESLHFICVFSFHGVNSWAGLLHSRSASIFGCCIVPDIASLKERLGLERVILGILSHKENDC